jgi:prophage regulatory protein
MKQEEDVQDRFVLKPEARAMSGGLSDVTLWRMEKRGEFPQRRQISPGRVGYLKSELSAWLESRPISDSTPAVKGED